MNRINQRKVGDQVRHKREGWIGTIIKILTSDNNKNPHTAYGIRIHGKPDSYFVAQSSSVEGVQR